MITATGRHRAHPDPSTSTMRARPLVVVLLAALGVLVLSASTSAVAASEAPTDRAVATASAGASPTPCLATVKACARLSTDEAWLSDGRGTLVLGAVRMNHGANGMETPTGRFTVQWKNKDHFSREAGGTPMPFSVFFDSNGRAFHGGDPARQSAGCIRLERDVAQRFFESLQPGDEVQILP